MRFLLFLLFSAVSFVCASEPVALEELTPTEATSFRIGKNVFGNPIRIAGVEYSSGITGHSGMSLKFNVGKEAEHFSALVGIEDETSPKDPPGPADAAIVILVDREIVWKRRIVSGEPAVPLDIDLRGKEQMELQAVWGKLHFPKQRIAIVQARFHTRNPDRLRTVLTAARTRRRMEKQQPGRMPDPPQWRNIQVRKEQYGGNIPAYRIRTRGQEIVLLPDFGGRIIHYSKPGGSNLLQSGNLRQYSFRQVPGKAKSLTGGHFFRPLPRTYTFLPPDLVLLHGYYDVHFGPEGVITMRSRRSSHLFLAYEYQLKIEENRIILLNRIFNTAPFVQKVGIWSITRLEPGRLKSVWTPRERVRPLLRTIWHPLPEVRRVPVPSGYCFLLPRVFPRKSSCEILFDAERPDVLAEFQDGTRFRIRYQDFTDSPQRDYPLHLYFSGNCMELESHRRAETLNPGESISFEEIWSMEDPPESPAR